MRAALLAAAALLAWPAGAHAAPVLALVGNFDSPVHVAAPPGDPARLFVVEQGGRVQLVKGGAKQAQPYADLSSEWSQPPVGERGLLSIAFPPDYGATGLAYVYLTAAGGDIQIRELQRSPNPDRAIAGPGRVVLAIPHGEAANHNGGQLAFGPRDGMLYAGVGDGGNANDTPVSDAENPGSLLGKILRIDPRQRAGQPYSVPAGNPFGTPVWAYGLRNPWRFSFDRATDALYAGDVGQGVREEIDVIVPGGDYGWRCWEGTILTPSDPNNRNSAPLCTGAAARTAPILEHDHADGFCSITGGVVVRDPGVPTLAGRYLYGDFCVPGLRSALPDGSGARAEAGLTVDSLSSFGEDACGRVHVVSLEGSVSRLQDGVPSACSTPAAGGPAPAPAAPSASADVRPCRLGVTRRRRQGFRRVRLRLRADEPCRLTLRARRYRTRTVRVAAGRRRAVALVPTRRGRRILRRRLAGGRTRLLGVRVTTRDAVGNLGRRRVRVRVYRTTPPRRVRDRTAGA